MNMDMNSLSMNGELVTSRNNQVGKEVDNEVEGSNEDNNEDDVDMNLNPSPSDMSAGPKRMNGMDLQITFLKKMHKLLTALVLIRTQDGPT